MSGGSPAAEVQEDGRTEKLKMEKERQVMLMRLKKSQARLLRIVAAAKLKRKQEEVEKLEQRVRTAEADLRRDVASVADLEPEFVAKKDSQAAELKMKKKQELDNLMHLLRTAQDEHQCAVEEADKRSRAHKLLQKDKTGGGRSDADAEAEAEKDRRRAELKMEEAKDDTSKLLQLEAMNELTRHKGLTPEEKERLTLRLQEKQQRIRVSQAPAMRIVWEAEKNSQAAEFRMEAQNLLQEDKTGGGRRDAAVEAEEEKDRRMAELKMKEPKEGTRESLKRVERNIWETRGLLKQVDQNIGHIDIQLQHTGLGNGVLKAQTKAMEELLTSPERLTTEERKRLTLRLQEEEQRVQKDEVLSNMEKQKLLQEDEAGELEQRVQNCEVLPNMEKQVPLQEKDRFLEGHTLIPQVRHPRSHSAAVATAPRPLEDRIRDLDPNQLSYSFYARLYDLEKKGHAHFIHELYPEVSDSEDSEDSEEEEEAEAVPDHGRQKRREQDKELLLQRRKADLEALDRIFEYDPKLGHCDYTRIHFVDLSTFDLDEESPLGPMRDTEAPVYKLDGTICKEGKVPSLRAGVYSADALKASPSARERRFVPCNSANIFSVKIVSSDVGFPINVYGTVIARDSLDLKCVYLFKRDRDDCQLILSKDESLVLTGPKRGLALEGAIYFEVDLKIKGGKKWKDSQLSKGYVKLDGIPRTSKDKNRIERYYLNTMLSKVVLTCAVEKRAVEATISVEVIQGKFYGEITAGTTGVRDRIVLHDSKLTADSTGKGCVLVSRRVIAVGLKEKMVLTARNAGACKAESTIKLTPGVCAGDEKEMTCGSVKMRVKVAWSIISRLVID